MIFFAKSTMCSLMLVHSGGSRLSLYDVNNDFVRLLATAMMIWSLKAVGIHVLCGNHFDVSHMRVDDVAGVQVLWQR